METEMETEMEIEFALYLDAHKLDDMSKAVL